MIRLADGTYMPFSRKRKPFVPAVRNRMAHRVARFAIWIRNGHCWILDRDDQGEPVPLRPRRLQIKIIRGMGEQAIRREAVRLAIAKYRRAGASTIVIAWCEFNTLTEPLRRSLTVAHEQGSAEEIFKTAKLMDDPRGEKKTSNDAGWKIDNKKIRASYQCITAGGNYSMSGGGFQNVHWSEVAKTAAGKAQKAAGSILNTVAKRSPETCIFQEATGQGPLGTFPATCRAARDNPYSEYKLVFEAWFEDPAFRVDEDEVPDVISPAFAGDEVELQKLGVTTAQLLWRRKELASNYGWTEFDKTPEEFGYDFPANLEQAFGARKGKIYPMLVAEKHHIDLDISKLSEKAHRQRWTDWGESKLHAHVTLHVVIDPLQPPQVVIAKKCVKTWEQLTNYARNEKTGKPLEVDDHCPAAFRYGVVTNNLDCLVYVYDELYIDEFGPGMTSQHIARLMHQKAGWIHPSGDPNHPDVARYERGPIGQMFELGVADRARPGEISQFRDWGIDHRPHKKPATAKFGEIEDGISHCKRLMGGEVLFRTTAVDTEGELVRRAVEKMTAKGKRKFLTTAEAEAWARYLSEGDHDDVVPFEFADGDAYEGLATDAA